MRRLLLYGAGGHARVVLDALLCRGENVVAVLDDEKSRWGQQLLGIPIVGTIDRIPQLKAQGVAAAVIGIGDNDARLRLAEMLRTEGFELPAVVHPSAVVSAHATVHDGAVVLPGAIVNAGADVAFCAVVNTGASVDHDCRVGEGAFLAPGSHLGGEVTVGERALIGIGAAVRPRIRIGARSIVGAGAAVVSDIPEDVVAVGVPARVIGARAVRQ